MSKVIAETKLSKDIKPFEERLYRPHQMKILDQSDEPSQFHPFLVLCSCGHQGRFYKMKDAEDHVTHHSGQTVQKVNTNGNK